MSFFLISIHYIRKTCKIRHFTLKKTNHTSDNTNTNKWWSVNWDDSLASIISATLIKNSNWETTATTTTTSINTQTKTQTECTTRQARKPLWSTFPFQHEPFYVLKWTKICRTSNCFVCSFFQTQSKPFLASVYVWQLALHRANCLIKMSVIWVKILQISINSSQFLKLFHCQSSKTRINVQ